MISCLFMHTLAVAQSLRRTLPVSVRHLGISARYCVPNGTQRRAAGSRLLLILQGRSQLQGNRTKPVRGWLWGLQHVSVRVCVGCILRILMMAHLVLQWLNLSACTCIMSGELSGALERTCICYIWGWAGGLRLYSPTISLKVHDVAVAIWHGVVLYGTVAACGACMPWMAAVRGMRHKRVDLAIDPCQTTCFKPGRVECV